MTPNPADAGAGAPRPDPAGDRGRLPVTDRDGPVDAGRVVEALLGAPFTVGNHLQVLRNGAEVFPALLQAVQEATRCIDMLWFAWQRSPIAEQVADALVDRARAGVRVRVLLDGFGALHVDRSTIARMRDAGCEVVFHRPLTSWRVTATNQRDHRRVLLCDEEIALTGGLGVERIWTGDARDPGEWRDEAVLVRGPAVAALRAVFTTGWLQTGRPLVGSADRFPPLEASGGVRLQVYRSASRPGWNSSAVLLEALLGVARHRVRITTPYIRLHPRFRALLAAAVHRGVRVQVIVSGPHFARRFVQLQTQRELRGLLDAGVEIWCYQPTVMHAKVMTVDGRFGCVGTANLDQRSMALNAQVGVLADDHAVTATLDGHLDHDLASSRRLSTDDWQRRGLRQRTLEAAADVVGTPLRGLGPAGLTGRWPR